MMKLGLDCLSCLDPMAGIHSYSIRDICSSCGGHSKVEPMNGKTVKQSREPVMRLKVQT